MENETSALVNMDELLAEAISMDSDADKGALYVNIPRIEIDNRKIDTEVNLPDGSKQIIPILCAPSFVEVGGKEEEYAKTDIGPSVEGVLLATTYKIIRKNDAPSIAAHPTVYHSYEFDTYDGTPVIIRQGGDESAPMSFADFSEMYKGTYVRWTFAYFLIGDKVYIVALKPSSGRILNNYKGSIARSGSHFSFHMTRLELEKDTTGDVHYYKIKPVEAGQLSVEDIKKITLKRAELNKMIKAMNTPKGPKQVVAQKPQNELFPITFSDVNNLKMAGIISAEASDSLMEDMGPAPVQENPSVADLIAKAPF